MIVVSILFLQAQAWAQKVTVKATIDEKCTPRDGLFTVPAGKMAKNLTLLGLSGGTNCNTGAHIDNPAWGISLGDACRTGNAFYYNVNKDGKISQTPAPLSKIALGPDSYCLHVDGGRLASVSIALDLAAGPGPGALPDFGPLDAGGMPGCLIELNPYQESAGWVLNSRTPYFVWAAPKRLDQPFTAAPFKRYGPWTLAERGRSVFVWKGPTSPNASLATNDRPTSTELSPALASLGFRNLTDEPVWLLVNPLPPGGCGPGAKPAISHIPGISDIPADKTGGGPGLWVQTDSWTSKWSDWSFCDIEARVEGRADSATTESSNKCDRAHVRFAHSWTALPETLEPGQAFQLELTVEDAGSAWTVGQGRGYTAVFVGSYANRVGDLPQDVRIPGFLDYACKEKDADSLFAGERFPYVASRIADWGYKDRRSLRPIDASLAGAAFLCRGGGRRANRMVSVAAPTLDQGDKFLVIVVGGHGVRVDSDTEEGEKTIGAHHTLYVEYSKKERIEAPAVQISGSMIQPKLIKHVESEYPSVAQTARVQGVVIVEATIDETGKVVETKIVRSIALLDDAAVAAVKQWRYEPYLLNGVPVKFITTVTVRFSLKVA